MAVLPPVQADPYAWPWDGNWTPQNTALIIIDMQVEPCMHTICLKMYHSFWEGSSSECCRCWLRHQVTGLPFRRWTSVRQAAMLIEWDTT